MSETLSDSAIVLGEAGFTTELISDGGVTVLAFEDKTTLGFIFAYPDPTELLSEWAEDTDRIISKYQLALRRAGQKAWNTYIVLLAVGAADHVHAAGLVEIEENLQGTRKIARAGVTELGDVRAAFLPLLPLQQAPKLEAVDIVTEIRERTTELPPRAVQAFLSDAEEAVILQVLEEAQ